MKKYFSLLLLTNFTMTSCKERGDPTSLISTPKEKTALPTDVITSGFNLIDGTSLELPKVQISKETICDSEAIKLKITEYARRADTFQLVICDSENPNSCSPRESSNTMFTDLDLLFPNTTSGDRPLVLIRSCVRSYNAEDPTKLCSSSWEESTIPISVAKGGSSAEHLLIKFQSEQKLTQLCWRLRTTIENYTESGDVEPNSDLATLLDENLAIGVDLCKTLIANYYIDVAEDQKNVEGKTVLSGVLGILALGSVAATITAVDFLQKRINAMKTELTELNRLTGDPQRLQQIETIRGEIARLDGMKGSQTVADKMESINRLLETKTPEQSIKEIEASLSGGSDKRADKFNRLIKVAGTVDGSYKLTYGQGVT